MDEKFKEYDSICATITQWLVYNLTEHPEPFCIKNVDADDKEDLCVLSIIGYLQTLTDRYINYEGSFWSYIRLKYFKKFKFLHRSRVTIPMFILDIHDFERELMLSINKYPSILGEIYDEYYRR